MRGAARYLVSNSKVISRGGLLPAAWRRSRHIAMTRSSGRSLSIARNSSSGESSLAQQIDRVREALVVRQIDAVVLEPHDLDHRHQHLFALDLDHPDFARDEAAARFLEGRAVGNDTDPEVAGEAFEARRQIHRVADYRVIEALLAAEIADHGFAGADADAGFDFGEARIRFSQRIERPGHRQRALERFARRILERERRAPKRHDAVAHQFIDHAAALQDELDHRGHVGVEERDQRDRVGAFRARGKIENIREQDGQVAALAAELEPGGIVHHRGDDVRMQVMLEGVAQMALLGALGEVAPAHHEEVGANEHHQRKHHAEDFAVGVEQVNRIQEVAGAENHRDDRARERGHVCGDEADRDADEHARQLLFRPQKPVVHQKVAAQHVVDRVGLDLDPGKVGADRRHEAIAERVRGQPDQYDLVLQGVGRDAMRDDVGNRVPWDRSLRRRESARSSGRFHRPESGCPPP